MTITDADIAGYFYCYKERLEIKRKEIAELREIMSKLYGLSMLPEETREKYLEDLGYSWPNAFLLKQE